MRRDRPRLAVLAVLAALLLAVTLPGGATARPDGVRLFVAVDGDDRAAGTEAAPLATLEGARDALRALRDEQAGHAAGAEVVLRQGRYARAQTFRLEAQDGGAADAPVRYRAAPGEAVVLYGGTELPPARFTPLEDAALRARLPDDAARANVRVLDLHAVGIDHLPPTEARGFGRPVRPAPPELFRDGRPLTLARWPNEGFTHTGEVLDPGSRPRDGETPDRPPRFRYEGTRPARWVHAEDAWLYGYWFHDWADESLPLASVDPDAGVIHPGAPHRYGVRSGTPYLVENLLEELDRPGEYYVDRRRLRLYVWPPEEASGRWVLSRLQAPLVAIAGASHLSLQGLTLETTCGDAIAIEDGRGVRVEGCTISNVGARAVTVRGGTGHRIVGCLVHGTGEGGVVLEGGDRATLTASGHVVTDCDIFDFSRRTATYRPAVHLLGCGHRVAHNHLHHAPHAAVIFGGNDHVIEKNEIDHVLSRTGDGGAVYCGRDWTLAGTIIRANHFHDLQGIGKWENAVYVDDQASGITIRGNLIERCHLGMLMGGGRRNVIEDNVFVDCATALRFGARGLGWAARMRPTLEERLAAVPYRDEPWRSRFPWLSTLLEDEPMAPRHNVIARNLLVRSGRIDAHLAQEVQEHGTIADNRQLPEVPDDTSRAPWADVGPRGR